jgi:hypothetical protein
MSLGSVCQIWTTYERYLTDQLGVVLGIARIDSHLTMRVIKSPDRRPQ